MSSRRSRRIQMQQQQADDDDHEDSEEEGMEEGDDNGDDDGEEDGENEEGEDESEESEASEDEEQDGDDGDAARRRGRAKGKPPGGEDNKKPTGRLGKAKDGDKVVAEGHNQSTDDMVHGCILYLLLQHHKKLPIKRPDVVKHALGGNSRAFPEVIEIVKRIFEEKFGIKMVGVEESRARGSYSSYILVSKYPQSATECASTRSSEAETKRAVLYLILAVIFMLGRSIDEDVIWQIFDSLHINSLVCKKRDDLRRFVKQEYVSPLYLNAEEVKETEQIYYRYSWGLRAESEISKYEMLKFVAKQFPEKKPYDFTAQYSIVLEQEKDLVEADRAEQEARSTRPDEDIDDGPSQSLSFDNEGQVESVELRGIGADEVNLRGMRPVTPTVNMEVDDNTENIAPAEANGEAMEEDENASESGSESGSGSGTASDEAQEGSEGQSVSESSASGSESDSD